MKAMKLRRVVPVAVIAVGVAIIVFAVSQAILRRPVGESPAPVSIDHLKKLGASIGQMPGQPVQRLSLAGTRATDADLTVIRGLPSLESLDLSGTPITDYGLRNVGQLHALVTLRLDGCRVTDVGLEHCAGLKNLRTLYLRNTSVSSVAALGTQFPGLHILDLHGSRVGDPALAHIASLSELEGLDLGRTGVTDQGLGVLAGLPKLRVLNLSHTAITDTGLAALNAPPLSSSLRALILDGCHGVTEHGIRRLRGGNLTSLGLASTKVPIPVLLSILPEVGSILSLDLSSTPFTDADVPRLLKLKGLRTVVLSDTEVTDKALEMLTESTGIRNLVVKRTVVTKEGVKRYKERNPHVTVAYGN